MTKYGYSRISSRKGQKHDRQLAALRGEGIKDKHIFCDSATGANIERQGLKNLLSRLDQGDLIVVTELARLGRSLRDLVNILGELKASGAHFKSINEGIDTSSVYGEFTFHLFATIAEFERTIIRQRQQQGIELAQARGDYKGSKPKLNAKQIAELKQLRAENRFTIKQLSAMFGVGKSSIYRYLKA